MKSNKLLLVVIGLSLLSAISSCSLESTGTTKSGQKARTEQGRTNAATTSLLVAPPSKEILELIESRQWNQAGREIYREALSLYPQSRDVALNQARSGFVDDAVESSGKMRPDVESWVLFRIARDTPALLDSKRIELLNRAASAVRGKAIAANLKSDALANAATVLVDLGAISQAQSLMDEALSAAQQGKSSEEQGAAYRMVADALERAHGTNIQRLISFAESGAKRSQDSFHKAFSYAAIASVWHRFGHQEKARQWMQEGVEIAGKISNDKQRALAGNHFARIALKMGDRAEAERQITARSGTFIDLLACEVMLDAAERGNYTQALQDSRNIRGNCASGFSDRGLGLRDVVTLQARRNDIAAARKTLDEMAGCSPRLVGEAWLAVAESERAAGQVDASQQSYAYALQGTGRHEGRPLDRFELFLLISIGDSMVRTGSLTEGVELLTSAISEVVKMPAQKVEDRIEGMARIAEAMAKRNDGTLSEIAAKSYRMAYESPQTGMYPEMTRARALARVGLMLTEAGKLKSG